MHVQNHNGGGGRQPVNQPAVVVDSTTAMAATLLLIMKCQRCLAVKLASLKCPKMCYFCKADTAAAAAAER